MRRHASEVKTALVGALKLAETGVDGLPIPGVQGCITGILNIIEQEELRRENLDTFRGLVNTITEFRTVTVERLSQKGNLSEDVTRDVQDLAKKLRDIPAQYNGEIGEQSSMNCLKGFIFAGDHAQALNNLGIDLKDAMELFRTALLVNIQAAEEKREADRLIDKLTLAVERKASFNAYREHEIDLCEQDTRVPLLADVTEWADGKGPAHEQRILWLNGRAGVGKSTIAQTLAARFHAQKILGGSFMFSKTNGVIDGSKVFTTIAYQLARHLPEFRDRLVAALRAKEDSVHAKITEQFEDLLATPLSQLQAPRSTVIIIFDALDECTPKTLPAMLTLLVENMPRFPFLRLLITSRPENSIRQALHRFTDRIHEVDLNEIPAAEDITTYLRRRLTSAYYRLMGDSNESQAWPAKDDLETLVRMADNLFVFAATAVRFIGDEMAADPQARLEAILHDRPVSQKHPFSTLDIVYREILKNALPEGEDVVHRRFRDIVGFIILASEKPSVNFLATLLQSTDSAGSIKNLLKSLHSVLVVPEDDDKAGLQVYHKSFADFITDPKRCTQMGVYVHSSFYRARICNWYLKIALLVQCSQEVSQLLYQQAHFAGTGMSFNQATNYLSSQLFALVEPFSNGAYNLAAPQGSKLDDDLKLSLMVRYNLEPIPVNPASHHDSATNGIGRTVQTSKNRWGTALLTVITPTLKGPLVSESLAYELQFEGNKCLFTAYIFQRGFPTVASNWYGTLSDKK